MMLAAHLQPLVLFLQSQQVRKRQIPATLHCRKERKSHPINTNKGFQRIDCSEEARLRVKSQARELNFCYSAPHKEDFNK